MKEIRLDTALGFWSMLSHAPEGSELFVCAIDQSLNQDHKYEASAFGFVSAWLELGCPDYVKVNLLTSNGNGFASVVKVSLEAEVLR